MDDDDNKNKKQKGKPTNSLYVYQNQVSVRVIRTKQVYPQRNVKQRKTESTNSLLDWREANNEMRRRVRSRKRKRVLITKKSRVKDANEA